MEISARRAPGGPVPLQGAAGFGLREFGWDGDGGRRSRRLGWRSLLEGGGRLGCRRVRRSGVCGLRRFWNLAEAIAIAEAEFADSCLLFEEGGLGRPCVGAGLVTLAGLRKFRDGVSVLPGLLDGTAPLAPNFSACSRRNPFLQLPRRIRQIPAKVHARGSWREVDYALKYGRGRRDLRKVSSSVSLARNGLAGRWGVD